MEPPPTVPPFPNYRLDGSAAQDKVPYDAPLQRYGQELRPHHRSHIQYLRSIWALYSAVYVNLRVANGCGRGMLFLLIQLKV